MLICVAHDGGIQFPMKAFNESVGCEISGCPRKVNATEPSQGVEEL
jgi:hypothetical protein